MNFCVWPCAQPALPKTAGGAPRGSHRRTLRAGACAWLLVATALAGMAQDAPAVADVGSSAPAPGAELQGAALVAALRNGGYVLYFRHTATDFSQNDERMRDFDDCANQRNLTDGGRAQATQIGQAWRKLSLPLGRVLASPYCRTREVAQLCVRPL